MKKHIPAFVFLACAQMLPVAAYAEGNLRDPAIAPPSSASVENISDNPNQPSDEDDVPPPDPQANNGADNGTDAMDQGDPSRDQDNWQQKEQATQTQGTAVYHDPATGGVANHAASGPAGAPPADSTYDLPHTGGAQQGNWRSGPHAPALGPKTGGAAQESDKQ